MALSGDILPIIKEGMINIKLQIIKVRILMMRIDAISILIGTTEI